MRDNTTMTTTPPSPRLTPSQFNHNAILSSLNHHGYCILENYIPTPITSTLQQEFTKILASTPTGRNRFEGAFTKRAYNLFNKTRAFDNLVTDPFLLNIIEEILQSEHYLLSSTVGISIGSNSDKQPPHRDDGKYPINRPHNELVMNMIVAIDDFTEENGGTVLYPGSHKWIYQGENDYVTRNVIPNELELTPIHKNEQSIHDTIPQLKMNSSISCVMPAGSIMLYRGSLLHGGGANSSVQPRCGVLIEFIQAWLRPQENHLLGVDIQKVAKLPRKLQELLGYTVSPPFIGYVDGRHPKRLLERLKVVKENQKISKL